MNMNLKGIMKSLKAKPGQVVSDPYARAFAPQISEAEGSQLEEKVDVTKLKKGDKVKINMGRGKEEVEVMGNFKTGVSKTAFVTLKRKVGAPYIITLSKLEKVLTEAEESEDHEVSMAQGSLEAILKHSTELLMKIGNEEKEIPAWIQDHIAKAESYIGQANDQYHEYGTNESINEITIRKGLKFRQKINGELVDYEVIQPNYYNAIKGGKTNLAKVIDSTHSKIKVGSMQDFSSNDINSMMKSGIITKLLNESTFQKGKKYGGSKCEGGCYVGKNGLMKLIKISKENPKDVFKLTDDNSSGLKPHYISNGVIAKATTLNPAYDLGKNKVNNLKVGNDVILSFTLIESVKEVTDNSQSVSEGMSTQEFNDFIMMLPALAPMLGVHLYQAIKNKIKGAAQKKGLKLAEAQKYSLGSAYLGNGLTYYNREEEDENGDFKKVAHIEKNGKITFFDKGLPNDVKKSLTMQADMMKRGVRPEAI